MIVYVLYFQGDPEQPNGPPLGVFASLAGAQEAAGRGRKRPLDWQTTRVRGVWEADTLWSRLRIKRYRVRP